MHARVNSLWSRSLRWPNKGQLLQAVASRAFWPRSDKDGKGQVQIGGQNFTTAMTWKFRLSLTQPGIDNLQLYVDSAPQVMRIKFWKNPFFPFKKKFKCAQFYSFFGQISILVWNKESLNDRLKKKEKRISLSSNAETQPEWKSISCKGNPLWSYLIRPLSSCPPPSPLLVIILPPK